MNAPFPFGIENKNILRDVTGLSESAFNALLEVYTVISATYKQGTKKPVAERKRATGAGRPPILANSSEELVYILYYLRHYPKRSALAFHFKMNRSTANRLIHTYQPLVNQALNQLGVLPKRSFDDVAEFQLYLKENNIDEWIIDATERPYFRHQDKEKRDVTYSGKKKDTPLKTRL